MGSERGSAALVVIGALAVSATVGVGVYLVIKDRRLAAGSERSTDLGDLNDRGAQGDPGESPGAVSPAPAPLAAIDPVPAPESAEAGATVDRAASEAIDPELSDSTPATSAPVFGTPGLEGQLDKDAIAKVVGATAPRLQSCFAQRRVKDNAMLRVTLEINRRGGVTEASSKGADDALGTCVVSVLKAVRFGKTRDGGTARVVYPIAFHAVDGATGGDPSAPPSGGAREQPCDEVSCVLDNYAAACCAVFKQPRPRPSEAAAPDSLSRDELMKGVQTVRGDVTRCATDAEFSGKFKVRFKVLPSGQVGEVSIPDVDPAMSACVTRAFKKATFSASRSGATVSFPFGVAL